MQCISHNYRTLVMSDFSSSLLKGMDFEGFFTNAGDKCCNAKAARFILKVGHLFVSIPYLSPLLLLFGQISIVYFQFRQ